MPGQPRPCQDHPAYGSQHPANQKGTPTWLPLQPATSARKKSRCCLAGCNGMPYASLLPERAPSRDCRQRSKIRPCSTKSRQYSGWSRIRRRDEMLGDREPSDESQMGTHMPDRTECLYLVTRSFEPAGRGTSMADGHLDHDCGGWCHLPEARRDIKTQTRRGLYKRCDSGDYCFYAASTRRCVYECGIAKAH